MFYVQFFLRIFSAKDSNDTTEEALTFLYGIIMRLFQSGYSPTPQGQHTEQMSICISVKIKSFLKQKIRSEQVIIHLSK
jgi:hypothetical protein